MVPASEVTNYQGNVALGLNSGGIEHYGDSDTKDLNNSVFNLAYLNMQKNKTIYDQKLKERNETYQAYADGAAELKDALPKDREILQQKIAAVKDLILANGGDIKSDPKVWVAVNDKLADFKTANTSAKSRLDEYNKGVAAAATETNPLKKNAMIDHWSKQLSDKNDIYQLFDPYQHTLDYDIKKSLSGAITKTGPATRDGDYDVTKTTTDVPETVNRYLLNYMNDGGLTKQNADAHFDDFFGQDHHRPVESVLADTAILNDKLKKIAALEGYDVTGQYQEGKPFTGPLPAGVKPLPTSLQPIKLHLGDDGSIGVSDRKDVAMSKLNLAMHYKREETRNINPEYAKLAKIKAETGRIHTQADADRAHALQMRSAANLNNAKAKKLLDSLNNDPNKVSNIFDDITARTKRIQETQADGKTVVDKDIVWVGDLPEGYTKVLSGVDKDGKPIKLKPLTYPTSKKDAAGNPIMAEYYEVTKTPYLISGKTGLRYTEISIKDAYDQQSQFTNLKDFRDFIIKKNELKGETQLQGANGTSTAESTIQGLRTLNNKAGVGKGKETLFQDEDNNTPTEE